MKNFRKELIARLDSGKPIYEKEVLTILLNNAYAGRDMSAVSEALLNRFPSIGSIFSARYEELVVTEGVTGEMAIFLMNLGEIHNGAKQENVRIKDSEACVEFALDRLRRMDAEKIELYFLNKAGKVISIKTFTSDSVDSVEVAANRVFMEITMSKAHSMYLVHNHVNCPCTPSSADDNVTLRIYDVCEMCKIKFADHCIVAFPHESFSYVNSGRLSYLLEKEKRKSKR